MLKNRIPALDCPGQPRETRNLQTKGLATRGTGFPLRIPSITKWLGSAMFLAAMFSCPSLRAEIIYNVGTAGITSGVTSTTAQGNSFSTNSSSAILNSISLYLAKSTASGSVNVNVYATSYGAYYGYLPTGPSLASATYNVADISADVTLYQFNFTGANAITLNANTHYAFMVSPTGGSLSVSRYSSNPYPNENLITVSGGIYTSDKPFPPRSAISGLVEVTAVPEPGTLILTGSALLAGAIGVYFTRRHRDQVLTPAAV